MRIKYLNAEYCQLRYADEQARVAAFQFRNQSSWYSHAHNLVRLAKIAYALGKPLEESRSYLRQATGAFKELFALRGTLFYTTTKYENDKPVKLEHFLKWSEAGAADNELVFVSGHPGRTNRLNTVTHLEFIRDVQMPQTLDLLRRREVLLKTFADRSLENSRRATDSAKLRRA